MSAITIDSRDEFEKVFPIPKYVIRCGKGYACTEYNAWDGHDFIKKWEGWSAAILHAQSDDDGEPTDDERIMAIEGIINCDRCGDEGWIVGEMGITRCACGQAGNSQVIPDGYVMVPKEPTDEMLAAAKEWTGLTSTAEVVYIKMLAAAPQLPGREPATVPGKWIPVSERMPDVGVKVLCFPAKDEPIHATFNGQLWLQDVSWSGSEEPIDNVIPVTVTHWMPLPAAPQEVKGE